MATPPYADDVSATPTYNDCLSLTEYKQEASTKDQLHHETLEALQMRPPDTSTNLPQLERGCATFRLLDLPPELREMVFDMALEELDCCEQKTFRLTLPFDKPNRVMALNYVDDNPCRMHSPLLLRVSRQVRSEAGKLYFGRKHFELFLDTWHVNCVETEVKMWLDAVVGNFATHLRQVTLHLNNQGDREFEDETEIKVKFSQRHGIQVTGSTRLWNEYEDMYECRHISFVDMPAYVATLEQNRIARKEKGQVIVDFFDDWDALRRACYGPRRKFLIKEEANDDDLYVKNLAELGYNVMENYPLRSW